MHFGRAKMDAKIINKNIPLVIFNGWEDKVIHAFSTRLGGVSKGACESLNLGFNRGDENENVLKNYAIIADALGVDKNSFVASQQTHKTAVIKVTKDDLGNGIYTPNKFSDIDGIYTDDEEVTLVTYYADCVPLFFYAPKHNMIGIAHAGWRGTVGEIGKELATIWNEQYGISFEDIEVGIGPSICSSCFEVHNDVADEFLGKSIFSEFVVYDKTINKYNIDLWECNKKSLEVLGIKKIYMSSMCTCCNPDTFFSHRKTGANRGSLAAFMSLRK
ncbi:MAG: hypothetical protein ATN35_03510 [Epulopiscium sp. Nele67-Bin004]|nr:MAG: hypothetical protein ATN35_03510 [Epulopiscium sp. Nele67-Bin004]